MTPEEEKKDIEKNKEMAAFSYFLIFSPLLLYTKGDSPFIQFHAKQAVIMFVIGIFLVILGKPFSYANLLVLAVCLTGIMQANMGKKWRVPIIADIVETGISTDSVWKKLTHYARLVQEMFVKSEGLSSPSISKIDSLPNLPEIKEVKDLLLAQQKKIEFLEQDLLLKTVLKGKGKRTLSPDAQKNIDRILETIKKAFPKAEKTEEEYAARFVSPSFSVLVGGFSEESIHVCFCGGRVKNEVETEVHFGNTKEEERITEAIKKLLG